VIHEFAHILGFPDLDADFHPNHLLADTLAPGVRRVVTENDLVKLDSLFESEQLAGLMDSAVLPTGHCEVSLSSKVF
jgi:hypothetical protein